MKTEFSTTEAVENSLTESQLRMVQALVSLQNNDKNCEAYKILAKNSPDLTVGSAIAFVRGMLVTGGSRELTDAETGAVLAGIGWDPGTEELLSSQELAERCAEMEEDLKTMSADPVQFAEFQAAFLKQGITVTLEEGGFRFTKLAQDGLLKEEIDIDDLLDNITMVAPGSWQEDLIEVLQGWAGPLFFYEAQDAVDATGLEVEYDTSADLGRDQFILSRRKLEKEELAAIAYEFLEEADLISKRVCKKHGDYWASGGEEEDDPDVEENLCQDCEQDSKKAEQARLNALKEAEVVRFSALSPGEQAAELAAIEAKRQQAERERQQAERESRLHSLQHQVKASEEFVKGCRKPAAIERANARLAEARTALADFEKKIAG